MQISESRICENKNIIKNKKFPSVKFIQDSMKNKLKIEVKSNRY